MRFMFEREALERPASVPFPVLLQIGARNFAAWLAQEDNNLLEHALTLVDEEDRRLRIQQLAGSELEDLFARYQTEREYRRLPRQAMSSEGFENYVNEILGDRPHSMKRILEGDIEGTQKRHRL